MSALLQVFKLDEERFRVDIEWVEMAKDARGLDDVNAKVIASAILFAAQARQVHPEQVLDEVIGAMNDLEYCGRGN